jgi:hypothetical protein
MGKDIIYLYPMHLTERVITGYHVLDTHDRLVNLDPKDRPQAQIELHDESKYNAGMYIYRAINPYCLNNGATGASRAIGLYS